MSAFLPTLLLSIGVSATSLDVAQPAVRSETAETKQSLTEIVTVPWHLLAAVDWADWSQHRRLEQMGHDGIVYFDAPTTKAQRRMLR